MRLFMLYLALSNRLIRGFEDSGITTTPGLFATGQRHNCAIFRAPEPVRRSLKCWGDNTFGQLGLGLSAPAFGNPSDLDGSFPDVDLGRGSHPYYPKWVATGNYHTCVILNDDRVKCFGSNSYGQIGHGLGAATLGRSSATMGNNLAALSFPGLQAMQVSAGDWHTCVLFTDGSVSCFGDGSNGALGYENELSRGLNEPLTSERVDLGTDFVVRSIASGWGHNCALSVRNKIKCWGANEYGQLGSATNAPNIGSQPGHMGDNLLAVDLGVSTSIRQLALGRAHTCVLFSDATVRCWGRGAECQNGRELCANTGTSPYHMGTNLLKLDFDAGEKPVQVCAGEEHTCVLYVDQVAKERKIRCFGRSSKGQCGNYGGGDTRTLGESSAILFVFLQGIICGAEHTCITTFFGTVRCWGDSSKGRLGSNAVGDGSGVLFAEAEDALLDAGIVSGTGMPSTSPTQSPSNEPTISPTRFPSSSPTSSPSNSPTVTPTISHLTLCGIRYSATVEEIT